MREKNRIVIRTGYPVRSLRWDSDVLVDWAGGGRRFSAAGEVNSGRFGASYRFDRAAVTSDQRFVALYEVLGTKGVILGDQTERREINRSYYHADDYEYPIALFNLPNGIPVIAHCPDEYNRIEIEELESGRRLTERENKSADFFHSRLQVSPGGTYLISAGWVWHPNDWLQIFRIADVLKSPAVLDQAQPLDMPDDLWDIHAVAFQSDDLLLLSGDNGSDDGTPHLAIYSLGESRTTFTTPLENTPGTMMAVGAEHVVGFFEHPKLFEIRSGKVIQEWPELKSGCQNSSIMRGRAPVPPLAFDPVGKRFAVADESQITVIELS